MTTPAQNDGGGQGSGGTGTGTDPGAGAPPAGTGGAGTATPPQDNWADRDAWKALADELNLSPADLKKKIEHARTWETRAKQNANAAATAQTLEQQVAAMRQEQQERDQRDLERTTRTAKSDLRSALVDAGLSREDATEALELIDPGQLITDGDVDDKKVTAAAKRLAKVAGRAVPDRDQGAGAGGKAPATMNDWVRQQVANKTGR